MGKTTREIRLPDSVWMKIDETAAVALMSAEDLIEGILGGPTWGRSPKSKNSSAALDAALDWLFEDIDRVHHAMGRNVSYEEIVKSLRMYIEATTEQLQVDGDTIEADALERRRDEIYNGLCAAANISEELPDLVTCRRVRLPEELWDFLGQVGGRSWQSTDELIAGLINERRSG